MDSHQFDCAGKPEFVTGRYKAVGQRIGAFAPGANARRTSKVRTFHDWPSGSQGLQSRTPASTAIRKRAHCVGSRVLRATMALVCNHWCR